MTNREALNACSDKAFVTFLLSQRGCILCVAKPKCPKMAKFSFFGSEDAEDDGLTCADRLLAWLKEEAPAKKAK